MATDDRISRELAKHLDKRCCEMAGFKSITVIRDGGRADSIT